ncbi:MAG: hypothetical protein RLY86_2555 [Pseudomonadota bacterium]|jgi:hypothetical protein
MRSEMRTGVGSRVGLRGWDLGRPAPAVCRRRRARFHQAALPLAPDTSGVIRRRIGGQVGERGRWIGRYPAPWARHLPPPTLSAFMRGGERQSPDTLSGGGGKVGSAVRFSSCGLPVTGNDALVIPGFPSALRQWRCCPVCDRETRTWEACSPRPLTTGRKCLGKRGFVRRSIGAGDLGAGIPGGVAATVAGAADRAGRRDGPGSRCQGLQSPDM